jgi:hypothetical protein
MKPPPFFRLAPAVLLGALGAACGGHKSAPAAAAMCELPPPQASALPTFTPSTVPNPVTQALAIAFGVKTTGERVTFEVPAGIASVTIVEQAASSAVPLTVRAGTFLVDNEPIPLTIAVDGTTIFDDVDMPPSSTLRSVNGVTVFDPLNDPSLSVYYLSFYASAWTGSLTLPNTSTLIPGTDTSTGAGVPAGTWTVTVSDWAYECRNFPTVLGCTATTATPSTYDVKVILKPAAAPASALKVVFHLVTSSGITQANASGNPDLGRLQWAMTQILAQAGIMPSFEYRDVPADVRAKYATGVDANSGGVCGDMDQLLRLAEAGNQLNVFLVDLIKDSSTGTPGYATVGLDPIVPGAASFGGTPASGVLVSIANLGRIRTGGCPSGQLAIGTCGDDVTAAIVTHEAGHFMGLYHDTDGVGTIVDPIADTPTCFCPLCKTGTGTCQGMGPSDPNIASPYPMAVSDCLDPPGSTPECGGGDNLMFWAIDIGSKGLLTAGQTAVMRASPVVE